MLIWRYLPAIFAAPFLLATTQFSAVSAIAEIARWVVLIVAVGFAVRIKFRRAGRRIGKLTVVEFCIVIFLAIFLISSLWSINITYSFQKSVSMILLFLAIFWALWQYADRYSEESLLNGFMFTIGTALAANLTLGWLVPRPMIAGRFNGFFENPNNIGILAVLAGSFALLRWLERSNKVNFFLMIVIFSNLILAGTRSALLGICLVIFLYISRSLIAKPLKAFIFFFSVSAFAFYLTQTSFFYDHILRVDSLTTGSQRTLFWDLAKGYISNRPIFGHGFGTDIIIHDFYGVSLSDEALRGAGVMSSYYGAAIQIGIPLAIIFFSLFVMFLLYTMLLRGRDFWAFHYAAILAAGLALAIFEPVLFSAGNAFSFLFYTFLMLLTRRLIRRKRDRHISNLAPVETVYDRPLIQQKTL